MTGLSASACNRCAFSQLKPAVLAAKLHRTWHFFPSGSQNHRQYSLHLPMEGWPDWVGLSGLENSKGGHQSQNSPGMM